MKNVIKFLSQNLKMLINPLVVLEADLIAIGPEIFISDSKGKKKVH